MWSSMNLASTWEPECQFKYSFEIMSGLELALQTLFLFLHAEIMQIPLLPFCFLIFFPSLVFILKDF